MANFKKLTIIFLALIFIAQASIALAIDINYPKVPGALTPQEIVNKPADEQLPLLINYFARLFFILAIAIVIAILIYAGVLYLVSGARPALMVVARERISQGLLGLLIIVCSYLILATINPQLLVFKISRAPIPQQLAFSFSESPNQITALQIPIGSHLSETLAYLDEKVQTKWGTYRVEVPFLEILELFDEAVNLTANLKTQLANCQCGKSRYYIKFDGLNGVCVGGNGEGTSCENKCESCGTSVNCNTDDVEKKDNKFFIKGREITDSEKTTSIKYMRLRLQEVLAELQAQKIKFSTEQISLIEKTLGINAANFLGAELVDLKFQEDFIKQKQSFESQGYTVVLEKPKQFPNTQTVTMSPPATDPLTYYAVISGPIIAVDQLVANENLETYKESQRASLFAVLSRLSLEEIQKMFQDCLDSAFGNGEFMLDSEQFLKIAEKAIQQSVADFLGQSMANETGAFADAFINKLKNGINDEANSATNQKNRLDACLQSCGRTTDCQNKCNGKTIPVNFLSNQLAEFLTADLKTQLPLEIQNILGQKLRDAIFSKDLNKIITQDMLTLLDGVFQGALKKTMEEQIPFLKENLQKTMTEVLPELILDPLQTVDYFLINNLKNLKKRVNNQIAELAMSIGASLSQPAEDLIEGFKKDNPQLFRENTDQESCQTEYENKGYYYNSSEKKCQKATTEQINNWDKDNFKQSLFNDFSQQEFCHRAEYCWSEKTKECAECQWLDVSRLSPSKENFQRIVSGFLSGLVNFGEQFLVAMTQTAVYTLTRYTQVWVEDEIIAPMEPYLAQLTDFQKNLNRFLNASVKELLPQQISQYLSSNIDQILSDICAKGKSNQKIKLYQGMEEIEVSTSTANKACKISEEFHQSIMDNLAENCTGDPAKDKNRLGCQIYTNLSATILTLLPKDIQATLNKSFAEILWPKVENIKEIIQGTPKEVLCGKFSESAKKCIKSTSLTGGLLPYAQPGTEWSKLDDSEKAYCYFIWYGCEKPLASWGKSIGQIISDTLKNNCSAQKNNDGCDVLVNNSVAHTLFLTGMEQNYGTTATRTKENKEKEIKSFQWLLVTFPELVGDIDKVVGKRNLLTEWNAGGTNSPKQEALNANKLNNQVVFQQNLEQSAMAFVNWFSKNNKVYDVLTKPQFGEMKYFHGENYSGENVLARTPYQVFYDDYCYKIKLDFKKDYPDWTIESIKSKGFSSAEQYSMESLNRTTNAMAIEELLITASVPDEIKNQYISCLILDFSPADIFGLDQQLIRYVQPKEYQIMFDLINNKLTNNERPDALNSLLNNYLYGLTPPALLKKIGQEKNDVDMIFLANLLDMKIGNLINDGYANEEIITLIFRAAGHEDLLNKVLGWQDWRKIQDIIKQTPSQLISKYFTKQLVENNKITQFSIMDELANGPDGIPKNSDDSVLGQPYIDTLGSTLHLTSPITKFFLAKDKFDEKVDAAIIETKSTIQNTFDKTFIEYPEEGFSWLTKSLAGIFGAELASSTASQIAGSCRKASSKNDCQANEVFKTETKECCDMGQGLACVPKCREKTEEEPCKIELGEKADGNQCCFDAKCQKCRESKTIEKNAGTSCQRTGETLLKQDDKTLCCKERTLVENESGNSCCVNVMDCITEKFTSYLEQLGDVLQNGPALNSLISSKKTSQLIDETCPANLSSTCATPEKLAACNNVPYPAKRAPELDKLLDCIAEKTKKPLPEEGESNEFFGIIFTYDHDHELCNYTHGSKTCSSNCSHSLSSCHYGGENGTSGALAVDIGNEANFEVIKEAAMACGTTDDRIIVEIDHIHISAANCDKK